MWRTIFFLLILANLFLWTWNRGLLGDHDAGREPERLSAQLHAEKLTVIGRGENAVPATCILLANLSAETAARILTTLDGSGLVTAVEQADRLPVYQVLIPALQGTMVDKKIAEIRRLGVMEFQKVSEAETRSFSIIFGAFKEESAATEALAALNAKGIHSARIEKREQPLGAQIEIKGDKKVVAQHVPNLLAEYPEATTESCP